MTGLTACKKGREVLLTLDEEVGPALFEACETLSDTEIGFLMSKLSNHIRKQMFEEDVIFDGDVSADKMRESVSPLLLHFVELGRIFC